MTTETLGEVVGVIARWACFQSALDSVLNAKCLYMRHIQATRSVRCSDHTTDE